MNSRNLIFLAAVMQMLFYAGQAAADGFYKWVDKQGNVHYSDSKAQAPPDGKDVQEKSYDDIGYNITPPVSYPTSIYRGKDKSKSSKQSKAKRSNAKANAGNLPWFTGSNFDHEVLRSGGLTMVEFWATWCGICRKVDPVINELAGKYGSRVKVGRVDIDEEKDLQKQYRVKGVPNTVFFKNGKVVGRLLGGHSRDSYIRMIEQHM
ncbi:MAG: thioredoxin domain-containing protein [Nitrospinota bacterium]|nr:thioredoxin domain-containing protein [Nitrospinota bacterium]